MQSANVISAAQIHPILLRLLQVLIFSAWSLINWIRTDRKQRVMSFSLPFPLVLWQARTSKRTPCSCVSVGNATRCRVLALQDDLFCSWGKSCGDKTPSYAKLRADCCIHRMLRKFFIYIPIAFLWSHTPACLCPIHEAESLKAVLQLSCLIPDQKTQPRLWFRGRIGYEMRTQEVHASFRSLDFKFLSSEEMPRSLSSLNRCGVDELGAVF